MLTQVLLLAAVCAGIGIGTEFALQRFLTGQLDAQVVEAGRRSTVIFDYGPPPPPGQQPTMRPPEVRDGPGPEFLNAPGQAIRTVGAVVSDGRPVDAGVITSDGARAELPASAAQQLADARPGRAPETVELDELGRYRVVGLPSLRTGDTVITGLPTTVVDDTLLRTLVIFCVVAAVAVMVAAAAGIYIIGRQLQPLSRVSDTAEQVAALDLDRGDVNLPTPIIDVDPAATRTEVGKLGAALNRMLDRIATALQARHLSETRVRQFVADASHELRTPLAAIRGYTELAQRRRADMPDEVVHAMNRVESEAARMTQLVEDMLLLARLDTGRPLQRDPVDLSHLVLDAVSDAHVAGTDHIWQLDLPEEPVTVAGDEARLHQVLANLLANARIHTPPGTTVTVSLSVAPDATAVLSVADDGPGIPEQLQPEVFERFARGDSSRARRDGSSTGLGLAIVAAVVRAHGGTIALHSGPGSTAFVVTLPGAVLTAGT